LYKERLSEPTDERGGFAAVFSGWWLRKCHPEWRGESPIESIVLSIVIPGRDCPGHVSGSGNLFYVAFILKILISG
jgi:hypothetical protein